MRLAWLTDIHLFVTMAGSTLAWATASVPDCS